MQIPKSKVLIFDCETTPIIGYAWGVWQQNLIRVTQNTKILSFAYKWLGQKQTHFVGMTDFPEFKKDKTNDAGVVTAIRDLFDAADVIVAHNGNAFDIKKVKARMLAHNLIPPSPFASIDTLRVARRHFKFDSNRLDDLSRELGVGSKLKHDGFSMWEDCMKGCPLAWKKMKQYNIHDVRILEQVYLRLRPWIEGHPNAGFFSCEQVCPVCGSEKIQQRGFKRTKSCVYKQMWCKSCHAWSRSLLREKGIITPKIVN
jgi:RNase_H superfamily